MALQFQSFMGVMMGKRQVKETLNRIRKLCSRCDFHYEFPPKLFGVEQAILLRRLELPATDDFIHRFTLSESLKYLESFYNDVRAQQKAFRKEDNDLRSKVHSICIVTNMGCVYTKRTRLNPPTYRLYDQVSYEHVLGKKISAVDVQNIFKFKRSDLSNTTPTF